MSRYRCPECGYCYDEARGEPHQGYPAGTPWDALPDDFACPDCAIRLKDEFEPLAECPSPAASHAQARDLPISSVDSRYRNKRSAYRESPI